jgi:hypothetical protein
MRELPAIMTLREDFAGKAEFVGINDEDPGIVKSFVKKNYAMAVLMDESRAIHKEYRVTKRRSRRAGDATNPREAKRINNSLSRAELCP